MYTIGKTNAISPGTVQGTRRPTVEQCGQAFSRIVGPSFPTSSLSTASHYNSLDQPPGYTRFTEFAVVPQNNLPVGATFESCLRKLQTAYQVDFLELANKIDFRVTSSMPDALKKTTFTLLQNEMRRENPAVSQLARRLYNMYSANEQDTETRADKNKLAIVVWAFFLEEWVRINNSMYAGSGVKLVTAESIRKELFELLRREYLNTPTVRIRQTIDNFLAERPDLRAELDGSMPAAADLQLSELRYEDIPGAVASVELRKSLALFSQHYGQDFERLVEAMGDGVKRDSWTTDPVSKGMTSLSMKRGCETICLREQDSYLDRNAKLVITAMNYFHKQVFGDEHQVHVCPTPGKKQSQERYPVQESSAVNEKIVTVKKRFIEFLTSSYRDCNIFDVAEALRIHLIDHWPKNSLPASIAPLGVSS